MTAVREENRNIRTLAQEIEMTNSSFHSSPMAASDLNIPDSDLGQTLPVCPVWIVGLSHDELVPRPSRFELAAVQERSLSNARVHVCPVLLLGTIYPSSSTSARQGKPASQPGTLEGVWESCRSFRVPCCRTPCLRHGQLNRQTTK